MSHPLRQDRLGDGAGSVSPTLPLLAPRQPNRLHRRLVCGFVESPLLGVSPSETLDPSGLNAELHEVLLWSSTRSLALVRVVGGPASRLLDESARNRRLDEEADDRRGDPTKSALWLLAPSQLRNAATGTSPSSAAGVSVDEVGAALRSRDTEATGSLLTATSCLMALPPDWLAFSFDSLRALALPVAHDPHADQRQCRRAAPLSVWPVPSSAASEGGLTPFFRPAAPAALATAKVSPPRRDAAALAFALALLFATAVLRISATSLKAARLAAAAS
eukprot:CAMPEP_0176088918 /NCGR_PEP_ID=MMETSP0120_2-20121206/44525_1 /TAXON_ID=160619 /ORGANISM="Kryptoperidinium foliaceum, Strain CCMP 1326" /LENGTH=275 /DNA_ID=CAMNT_0017422783 /DNA_START=57 /DNA_END=881 /DNA_ORIENTATION=-